MTNPSDDKPPSDSSDNLDLGSTLPSLDDIGVGPTIRGFVGGQKVFDRYVLRSILGRGGMGVVWLARDEQLERDVALKFMPELVRLDPQAMDELKRETRKSLELTHPSIVRIYDYVQDPLSAAIAMEYVDGPTLSALRIQKPNRLFEVEDIRTWIEEICAALQYAHDRARVVHRDLKPANLMLTGSGQLKIADFGIARSLNDSTSRLSVADTDSSGTMAYMSPQQALGERPSAADDIYSLGATIYDLLTGKPPFHSGNIYAQVRDKVPLTMAARREEFEIDDCQALPSAWEETVAACLAKEPSERPPSIAAVWEALNRTAPRHPESKAQGPKSKVQSPESKISSSRSKVIWISTVILVLALLAGWWFGYEMPRRAAVEDLASQQARQTAEEEAQAKADEESRLKEAALAQTAAEAQARKEAEAQRLADAKRKADEAAAEKNRLESVRKQLIADTADLVKKSIQDKRWTTAKGYVDKLASLDPNFAGLPAMQKQISDASEAQKALEARAQMVPSDLPAGRSFSIPELFAPSRYARYNSTSKNAILERAQAALISSGFHNGKVDGDAGPNTQTAILKYQRANLSLGVTGRLDDPTLTALGLAGIAEMAAPTPRPRPRPASTPRPSSGGESGFFKDGSW